MQDGGQPKPGDCADGHHDDETSVGLHSVVPSKRCQGEGTLLNVVTGYHMGGGLSNPAGFGLSDGPRGHVQGEIFETL